LLLSVHVLEHLLPREIISAVCVTGDCHLLDLLLIQFVLLGLCECVIDCGEDLKSWQVARVSCVLILEGAHEGMSKARLLERGCQSSKVLFLLGAKVSQFGGLCELCEVVLELLQIEGLLSVL